jgi:hypothetical protein
VFDDFQVGSGESVSSVCLTACVPARVCMHGRTGARMHQEPVSVELLLYLERSPGGARQGCGCDWLLAAGEREWDGVGCDMGLVAQCCCWQLLARSAPGSATIVVSCCRFQPTPRSQRCLSCARGTWGACNAPLAPARASSGPAPTLPPLPPFAPPAKACAEALIAQGYTSPSKLAIMGGSNGAGASSATPLCLDNLWLHLCIPSGDGFVPWLWAVNRTAARVASSSIKTADGA